MFIAALFVIARSWRKPRCLSTKEWIKKMYFMYIMECESVIKNKGIMNFAAKWMGLKNILSEVTQTQRYAYHIHGIYSLISGYLHLVIMKPQR